MVRETSAQVIERIARENERLRSSLDRQTENCQRAIKLAGEYQDKLRDMRRQLGVTLEKYDLLIVETAGRGADVDDIVLHRMCWEQGRSLLDEKFVAGMQDAYPEERIVKLREQEAAMAPVAAEVEEAPIQTGQPDGYATDPRVNDTKFRPPMPNFTPRPRPTRPPQPE